MESEALRALGYLQGARVCVNYGEGHERVFRSSSPQRNCPDDKDPLRRMSDEERWARATKALGDQLMGAIAANAADEFAEVRLVDALLQHWSEDWKNRLTEMLEAPPWVFGLQRLAVTFEDGHTASTD